MTRANALQYARARVGLSAAIVLMASLGASPVVQGAADPSMTNTDVINMVAAKLGDAVIITAIQSAPRADFDLSPKGLIALKQNGASDAVIAAMQKATPANRPQPAAPAAPVAAPVPAPPPAAAAPRAVGFDPVRDFRAPAAEPSEREVLYVIDQSTGALTALKQGKTKEQRVSSYRVSYYFPGPAAATRFRVGAPFGFAIRFASTITEVEAFASPLLVDGDKRFLTKMDADNMIRFRVRNLGQATSPTADNKKDPPDTLYEITPLGVLLEGEFILYVMWKARIYHSGEWTIGFDYR